MSEKPAVPGRPKILAATATPEAEEISPTQKMQLRRKMIADEVLTTEASYCASLSALVDIAITALQQILTEDENKLLFSNIATILQFNQNFCANLDQRLKTWNDDTGLGDIFLQFTPFLKMYTQYVSNHEAATLFERDLCQQARFQRVAREIFGNPRMSGSSTLSNFLIMPIQRIPRYSLLLNELVRHTPTDHADLPLIQKALEQVNQVAKKVNADIEARQNRELVYEKTVLLGLDEARFVQPSRYFVKQGPMTKVCRSHDALYEVFLFNDVFIYASRSPVGKFKVHREIPIDTSFAIQDSKDDEKRQNQFKIINSVRSFAVYNNTAQEKEDWMKVLTQLIQKAKSKIQSKDEEGVIVPVWIPDDQAKGCLVCKNDFSFFNRKHHCRFCGGVVCSGCSKRKAMLRGKEERICDQCVDVKTKFASQQQMSNSEFTSDSGILNAFTEIIPAEQPPTSVNYDLKPQPLHYRAVCDNPSEQVGDLGFGANDVVLVYLRHADSWWTGTNEKGDAFGIFLAETVKQDPPADFKIKPICAALTIQDPLSESQKGPNPAVHLNYAKGDIIIVVQKTGSWALAYNLANQHMGYIHSAVYADINADAQPEESMMCPPTPSPVPVSVPIPSSPAPQPKPNLPLPQSPPPPSSGPPTPAATTATVAAAPVPPTPRSGPPAMPSGGPPPPAVRQLSPQPATLPLPNTKFDGPSPAGSCKSSGCKCDAFKCIAIRKGVCSDCGHNATEHNDTK